MIKITLFFQRGFVENGCEVQLNNLITKERIMLLGR